jgi:hypothetical protein
MRPLVLIVALTAFLILAGCGYVGEPLTPALNMPHKVMDLRAVESGDRIVVEFTIPDHTTEELLLTRLGEVELRMGPGGPPPFDFGRWAGSAPRIPVAGLSPGPTKVTTSAKNWAGQEVLLAVRVSSAKGRFSDWSNPVVLPVVAPIGKPADVRAEAVLTGVKVSWQSVPRDALSFRVYRRAETEKEASVVATPAAPVWIDTAATYGKRYIYSVRAVVKTSASEAESELSVPVEIVPVDKFPPAVPAGLTAAASPDSIELAWDRNTDPDFACYRVYRSVDGTAFEKIADSIEAPNYSDRRVSSGKRYRYAVSAVDLLGNESARSQPTEAAAH